MEQTQQQTAPPAETQQPQAPPQAPPATETAPKIDRAMSLLDKIVEDSDVRREAERFVLEQCQFTERQRSARVMYEAGLYNDLKKDGDRTLTPSEAFARAMVKIELGHTMGIDPVESMNGIYFVYGRPSLESGIRAAKMKRHGYDWVPVQHDNKGCRIALKKDGKWIMKPVLDEKGMPIMEEREGKLVMREEPVIVSFVEADARAAGLLDKKGSLYKVWPQIMYFNRCIGIAQRVYAPEVLNGAELPSREEAQEMPQIYTVQEAATAPTEGTMEAALDVAAAKLAKFTEDDSDDDEPVMSEKPKSERPAPVSANPGTLFQGGLGKR